MRLENGHGDPHFLGMLQKKLYVGTFWARRSLINLLHGHWQSPAFKRVCKHDIDEVQKIGVLIIRIYVAIDAERHLQHTFCNLLSNYWFSIK